MSATVLIMLLVTGAHCGSPAGVVLGTGDRVTVCAMLCHGLTAPTATTTALLFPCCMVCKV